MVGTELLCAFLVNFRYAEATKLTGIFKKLIRQNKIEQEIHVSSDRDNPTVPVHPPLKDIQLELKKQIGSGFPSLLVGNCQSVGMVREHNEDSLFSLATIMSSNGKNLPLGLFIIADGMGGHTMGEAASRLAVQTVSTNILEKLIIPTFGAHFVPEEIDIEDLLRISLEKAHQAIASEAPGSGTTITTALMIEESIYLAHVGDSRAYWISPDGTVKQHTRDHSFVMRMIELGQITAEQAENHPQRNILYQALGQGEPLEADIHTIPKPVSGYLLVCSDGLWGVVPQETLTQLALTSPDPQTACEKMVDAANDAGGPDNISAILVRIPD